MVQEEIADVPLVPLACGGTAGVGRLRRERIGSQTRPGVPPAPAFNPRSLRIAGCGQRDAGFGSDAKTPKQAELGPVIVPVTLVVSNFK